MRENDDSKVSEGTVINWEGEANDKADVEG